jgi:hypothetical protein
MLAIALNPDRKRQILYLQSRLRFPSWASPLDVNPSSS